MTNQHLGLDWDWDWDLDLDWGWYWDWDWDWAETGTAQLVVTKGFMRSTYHICTFYFVN